MVVSRRRFLKLSATGVGAAAGALSWPFIWSKKTVFAQPTGLAGRAGGAIFVVLNGGARTQAMFNGTVGAGANPFGQLDGLTVPLSSLMQNTGLDDPEVNQHVNLVTTAQHHNRTANHDNGRVTACTGYSEQENKPGILTILNYAFSFRDVPCVNVGQDTPTTRIGSEIASTFAPIKIRSPLDVEQIVGSLQNNQVSEAEQGRLNDFRYALQDRFLRSTTYREPADIPFFQRKAVETAQQFENDALDISTDGSMGRYLDGSAVSNGGLRNSLGVGADTDGIEARGMLAVRLRQLGCAGITISSSVNFDMHGNEERSLPGATLRVGRAIGGMTRELARIEDPYNPGQPLLNSTVITVLTDFNRGNWSNGTGFNGDGGSDHVGDEDKTCFQCIPIIGGGTPGGRILGQLTAGNSPAGGSRTYETRQVLATVLDLLGVPSSLYFPAGVTPLSTELA